MEEELLSPRGRWRPYGLPEWDSKTGGTSGFNESPRFRHMRARGSMLPGATMLLYDLHPSALGLVRSWSTNFEPDSG